MVTFRKDIHLGRQVPVNGCLFWNITSDGILTDKFGRKWQLTKYEEDTPTPTPTTGDKIYYGWGIQYDEFGNGNNEQIIAQAKGWVTQTTTVNQTFTNNAWYCIWKAYPVGKEVTINLQQNGQTTNDKSAYSEDDYDEFTYNGIYYRIEWAVFVGNATITAITVS